jgi:hypothetical protein
VFAFISTAKRAGGFMWHCLVLLSVALGLGAVECQGQALPTALPALAPSRLELYGGYAYFRPLGGTIATRRYDAIQPGGVGSATYYFDRYLGVQAEIGAFPNGRNDSVYTGQAGAVARYPYGRISPFVHVLGGVVRQSGPAQQPQKYGWGGEGGAGVDYVVPGFQHQLAIRLAEADFQYTHVDYGTLALPGGLTGGLGEIKAYRLSAGMVFRFGGGVQSQESPLMYSCAASPTTIFAGDPVIVTGTTVGASMGKRSVYTWATNGGQISGTAETANISTTGLAAGDYTITGHISQGKHAGEVAECTTNYTVQAPQPPTISCSADPLSVSQGSKVTITSEASSPQNRPLRFSYSASAGDIASTIAIATLNTANAPPGRINVECRVNDDLGQSATAVATVNVASPLPPAPEGRELCSLNFARDRKRPVRVDNEAKACLDDVALTLNRESTARLEITGERSADEATGQAVLRAMNARQYLAAEKGIDPARIDVKTGTADGRSAEIELLPIGTPVHYSDGPVGSRAAPGRTPGTTPYVDAVTPVPMPRVEGPGSAGLKRLPDSLVLPPLPDGAIAKRATAAPYHRTHHKKRRRRHKPAAATSPEASRAK